MMWLQHLFIVVILTLGVKSEGPVISIKNGQVRGLVAQTPRHNLTFYTFIGIPYAEPPIGKLRFQPPQPISNWSGILETKKSLDKYCYQADLDYPTETEDCLYISVITPTVNPQANLPVLVHIHGGGFVHGHGMHNQMQAQLTIERGLIVVSMNYRLGPFGFLSTGDLLVPGNMGLKDQHLAIKWVNENIKAFGGDPSKVTITGQSAGGASVTYQLLNRKNQGLFRAAISNSGTTLCDWAYQRHSLESAYGIAHAINSSITKNATKEEVVEFLQNVNSSDIDKTGEAYHVWAPVMEIEHPGAFFSNSMYELVKNGEIVKVPLLLGFNSEECIYRAKDINTIYRYAATYDKKPGVLVNEDMYITDNKTILKVAAEIKSIYTNGSWLDNIGSIVKYMSDDRFNRAIIKYAELQSLHTDVYFYQFSYHGELGQNNVTVPGIGYGVGHAEDQRYLWAHYERNVSDEDLVIVDRYVTLLTNFAKTLNPTPEKSELFENIIWKKASPNNFTYLNIDTNLTSETDPREFSYSKWVKIWEADAKKPFISF